MNYIMNYITAKVQLPMLLLQVLFCIIPYHGEYF